MLKNIKQYIEEKIKLPFADKVSVNQSYDNLFITCEADILLDLVRKLFFDKELKFAMLIDMVAVDYPEREKRFEVIYCLLSLAKNYRINVKVKIADGVLLPSLNDVFQNTTWLEREIWDMYGIKFSGWKDDRRLLTDYGFDGHPLRKDFPLSGHKEVKYDAKSGKVIYQPVSLTQEYMDFDFSSPWQGNNVVLPGDEKAEKSEEKQDD